METYNWLDWSFKCPHCGGCWQENGCCHYLREREVDYDIFECKDGTLIKIGLRKELEKACFLFFILPFKDLKKLKEDFSEVIKGA